MFGSMVHGVFGVCRSNGATFECQKSKMASGGHLVELDAAISLKGYITIEVEYKVVCALSNCATFDDLE